jgi:prephenate dehydratase
VSRVAFLGPPGTFTEEALLAESDLAAGDLVAMPTIPEVIATVEAGNADTGVVPIENSIEGSIDVSLDLLAFSSELLIQREMVRPVALNLVARRGIALRDVRRVVSLPYATAQCREWLTANLPQAELVAANSTADAVERAARSRGRGVAAVGTRLAAELYGLDVLVADVEDHPENATRFVLVGHGVPAPSGHDKTSVVVFQREDRPGSLLAILQEFAARAINITKLESRPTKRDLGDYCFFIDFEGHLDDELVADCLRNLAAKQAKVKFLGSYPVAGDEGHVRRKAATKAWRDANTWLDGLRDQIRAGDAL